jgi:bifunctional non-homologous end joining protein LigD
MHPPGCEPMLAGPRRAIDDGGWAFEPKLDGWRALVHVTGGVITVYSRPGRDVSASVPELAGIADAVPPGTVLDGELVSGSGNAASFYRLGSVLATRPALRRTPVAFVAFDVLRMEGRPVVELPCEQRRSMLVDLEFGGAAWCTVRRWADVTVDDLIPTCEAHGVEGVVAKRLESPYRPGRRSTDWVKIKCPEWTALHAPLRHSEAATTPG